MDLDESLKSHFGFDRFRLGQMEAVQSLLEGRHTLVVMPTGSGQVFDFPAGRTTDGRIDAGPFAINRTDEGPGRQLNSARNPGNVYQQHA